MFKKHNKSKERNKYDDKLLELVMNGDAVKLRQAVEKQKYSSLLSPDQFGRILIFEAIQRGFKEMVEILVDADISQVHTKNKDGLSPVHVAAKAGYHETVTFLLKKKSAVDPVDKKGQTPLHFASVSGSTDSLQALIAHQADTEKKDVNGNTALLLACQAGQKSTAISLMNASSNINAINRQHKTPLMLACERGLTDVVRLLLQRGAQAQARDTAGKTARYYAETVGHTDCAQLLPEDDMSPSKAEATVPEPLQRTTSRGSGGISRRAKNEIDELKRQYEEEKANHEDTKNQLEVLREQWNAISQNEENGPVLGNDSSEPKSQDEEIQILKKRVGSVVLEKKQLEQQLETLQASSNEDEVKKLKKRVHELELEIEDKHDGVAMVPLIVVDQLRVSSEAKIASLEEKVKSLEGGNTSNGGNISDSLLKAYRSMLVQAVKGTLDEGLKEKILAME
eukprot:m.18470 g.18470  ORF g.18470 m.18470 type:complete len:453 (+) comp4965_c0_seq1:101-1459(+)